MKELLLEHEQCEAMGDVEGTMATLVEHPVFELHPQGLRIEGYEAVREMYGKFLQDAFRSRPAERKAQMAPTLKSRITAFADSLLVTEANNDIKFPDGSIVSLRFLVLVYFQDGKILGERLYSDNDYTEVVNSVLGPDFINFPGVTTIVDDYPYNPGA
jgi:hypothetical protein